MTSSRSCSRRAAASRRVVSSPRSFTVSPLNSASRVSWTQNSNLKLVGATVTMRRGDRLLSVQITDSSGVFRSTIGAPVALGQGADVSLSKVLPDGTWRVRLSWGKHPSDLDSHLYFGKNFEKHVFSGLKSDTAAGTGVSWRQRECYALLMRASPRALPRALPRAR